ncbi:MULTISPECIES: sugar kinase [unclassified Mesorhizobium]|uniref:tagatose kinase n=1 Tax=unclassified Mesorhizobium TaxID=325217 RepID=UPI00112E0215|nr:MULTISPECIES: sugar kinase [unclassified Mesorhizobium]MCA0028155.1 sugar kinase [Mesorhizobium sp. B263B1A]TPJ54456.1 sugar kinase [Mesorhizobium sp. B2-6-4]TPJ86014.1 sugar kinase [Mesorhizobium sp. B2-5-12]TPK18769.1 sugar kinase [Mesorhizobium sp. B2-5-6]TPM98930.1 sugar kinase [Mesorhizobium sp. B2-1-5]
MPSKSPLKTLAPDGLGPTVTVGEILVEIMATSRGNGFLEPIELTGPYPSGAPAIFIDQCARLGGRAGIIACVGDDDFGRINVERLRRDGADVTAIAVSPDYPTGSAFVRYREDGSRDFVYNIGKSAAARVGLTPEARALLARSGHLHVMGTALSIPVIWEVLDHAIDVVKGRGGSISLDPNLRKELLGHGQTRERFARLLDIADLILPSGEELHTASGNDNEADALASLFARGAGEVVVKRGALGASLFGADGSRVESPGFLVEEIDPTGAGDCFGGAYIACRRLGMPAVTALDYANAAGARNVTRQGPMEGAGTRAELDLFIANTPRRRP